MQLTPSIKGQVLAVAIGISGGSVANAIGVPLPWMLGPMLATAAVALIGMPVRGPVKLRPFIIPILGVLLGSGVTPETIGLLGQWSLTLLVLPVFLGLAALASYAVYRKLGRYDQVTAFYAAMPGGLNEMLVLGTEAGGNERRIALAHAARVMLIITFVALFFGLFLKSQPIIPHSWASCPNHLLL